MELPYRQLVPAGTISPTQAGVPGASSQTFALALANTYINEAVNYSS